jgi:hypothetical protein
MTGSVGDDFFGLPCKTGNGVDVPVTFVCTFRAGQLICDYGYFDTAALDQQAGIVRAAVETSASIAAVESFVDGWTRFWADPTDSEKVRELISSDVGLHWPGVGEPLHGPDAYLSQLAAAVERVPDLRLSAIDYAHRGELLILAWEGHGTIGGQSRRWSGVDRFRLRDARTVETTVIFDTRALAANRT